MSDTAEGTNKLHELFKQMLEKQDVTNTLLSELRGTMSKDFEDVPANIQTICIKIGISEMRQCQLFGQGTDCSRMTSLYLRGHTALWSEQTRQTIVKMVYNKGIDSIAYQQIFKAKDEKRIELCAVIFFETLVLKSGKLYNAFSDRGRPEGPAQMAPIWGWLCHCHRRIGAICSRPSDRLLEEHDENCAKLYKLMPSFRKELIAEARAMDKAIDHATRNNLTKGTYELEITKALGDMPPELEQIINVCLPVNKYYKPETSDNDLQFDDFDTTKISQAVMEYFNWAGNQLQHEGGNNKRAVATEAITWWCYYLWDVKKANNKIVKADNKAKRRKLDEEAVKKREAATEETDMKNKRVINEYFKNINQKYSEILTWAEQIDDKSEAEDETEKAQEMQVDASH